MAEEKTCQDCQGTGWILESSGPGSVAKRCQCFNERQTQILLGQANIPRRYQSCSLKNFEVSQRKQLVRIGLDIREYKPEPANRAALLSRANPPAQPPVFALHAKSMVIDNKIACVGTFNFDPRSENLNTEVAAIIHHEGLAQRLQAVMEADMQPENSWSAADEPDQYVPLTKRGLVRLWQLLPLKPLL